MESEDRSLSGHRARHPGIGRRSLRQRVNALPLLPTLLAIALAAITLPLTIATIASVETVPLDGAADTIFPTIYEAAIGSVGAVLAGALVGGTLGGLAVRQHPLAGAAIALVTAWPAAVVGFAIVPGLTGHPMAFGEACLDACFPALTLTGTLDVGAVLERYIESLRGGFIVAIPSFVIAALLVIPAAVLLDGRWRWVGRGFGYVAVAICVLGMNAWSVQTSGASFFVLTAGVAVWAALLGREVPRPAPSRPPTPWDVTNGA